MNKTGQYIANQKKILSIYFTADYPVRGSTIEILNSLQNSGADLVEIGIPFSDPMADGSIIQKSSQQALENGFSLENLFKDLKAIQPAIKIPIVLMGYFNTILAYGVEKFLAQCTTLSIDTIIIPDLPPDIYEIGYSTLFKQFGISPVFLITPQTTETRIEYINNLSNSFIYAVAQNSITGGTQSISKNQLLYFKRVKETSFKVPVLIGFGISDHRAYNLACEYAQGAIIGSAFIKTLENANNLNETIHQFIHSIKEETR